MTAPVIWTWEQTPEDWFRCIRPVKAQASINLEVQPFNLPKKVLNGTKFTYQLGLSSSSTSSEIKIRRTALPAIPVTGDTRSGIIIFDGQKIVGSYIIPGNLDNSARQLVVDSAYRGMGIATRMLEQWFREVPSVPALSVQPVNIQAVKTFLKALHNTVNWAVSVNKPVSQEVKDAWNTGVQETAILSRLQVL